jgi:hypothetical protein
MSSPALISQRAYVLSSIIDSTRANSAQRTRALEAEARVFSGRVRALSSTQFVNAVAAVLAAAHQ